ncbi:MAG: GtrA family protein [Fibrobacter sp.]|jgi:putative flippase GtrA|nr:GtrA family protein [Fibrobacter sp.]
MKKVILYLLSSGITGLIYIGMLYLFNDILKWHHLLSVSISYGSAMTIYFLINKLGVFQAKKTGTEKREVIQFIILIAFNYLVTLGIVAGIEALGGGVFLGSAIAGVVTVTLTFFVFDRLLFKRREGKTQMQTPARKTNN